MMRMSLAAIAVAVLGTQALAQTCDTLGGGLNCKAGRSGDATLYENKTPPRTPDRTIGPDKDQLKIIGSDTSVDPNGQPKATLGGTTIYSDGRQCTRVGLTMTCK